MTIDKWFVFTFLLLLSNLSSAYKAREGNVTATWGSYFHRTDYDTSHTNKDSRFSGGFGIVATGDLSQKGALEIAIFQLYKTYFRDDQGYYLGENTGLVHVSMGYRWWLSARLSTSLSFYSAYSMGKPRYVFNEFPSGQEVLTSARDTAEYGFDLAAQSELWSQANLAIVIEGRYSLSVTNKIREHGNHYGFFLGLRHLIQEKGQKNP